MVTIAKPAGPAPSISSLNETAIKHLSRYATTEAGLVRVLERHVHRWARAAAVEDQEIASYVSLAKSAARNVARSMVEKGLINDALFASARAARLARSGRSNRAVTAYLAEKGVAAETARAVLPGPELEISAALAYARRRRLGPFHVVGAAGTSSPEDRRQELHLLARAGFPRDVAEQVLKMPRGIAEMRLLALKKG